MKTKPDYLWFLVWRKGRPYVTAVCGYTRRQVLKELRRETFIDEKSWRRARREGASIEKIDMTLE